MQRNMDLARNILLAVEANGDPTQDVDLNFTGFSHSEIMYHVKLLKEAGLLEADEMFGSMGPNFVLRSLTWNGHEFLDAIKNETVWHQTKAVISEKGGGMAFEVVKALALSLLAKTVGL